MTAAASNNETSTTIAVAMGPCCVGCSALRDRWRSAWKRPGFTVVDVALALYGAGIRIGVLNPRTVSRFSETLRRTKTDPVAALVLSEYARRMPWHAWIPPSPTVLALRAITRHWATVTKERTMQRNRLHAAESCAITPRCVTQDLKRSLRMLEVAPSDCAGKRCAWSLPTSSSRAASSFC